MQWRILAGAIISVLILGACGAGDVEPTILFAGDSCSSSNPTNWPAGAPEIVMTNDMDIRTAAIMGTYADGYERADLVDYGSDVSTRPGFINALEIFEAAPESTGTVVFDHGPGTYFMVCMPAPDTMVVLQDVVIKD